jgi:hypothetical protein
VTSPGGEPVACRAGSKPCCRDTNAGCLIRDFLILYWQVHKATVHFHIHFCPVVSLALPSVYFSKSRVAAQTGESVASFFGPIAALLVQ